MKMCSHTVAVAIKLECFVKWYRTMKFTPTFSALTNTGKQLGKKQYERVSQKSVQQFKKYYLLSMQMRQA